MQIRMGLIQKLETTHLVPVAASSSEVMTLLRPGSGSSFSPGSNGLINATAPEDVTWEAMSCVVSKVLRWEWQSHKGYLAFGVPNQPS